MLLCFTEDAEHFLVRVIGGGLVISADLFAIIRVDPFERMVRRVVSSHPEPLGDSSDRRGLRGEVLPGGHWILLHERRTNIVELRCAFIRPRPVRYGKLQQKLVCPPIVADKAEATVDLACPSDLEALLCALRNVPQVDTVEELPTPERVRTRNESTM